MSIDKVAGMPSTTDGMAQPITVADRISTEPLRGWWWMAGSLGTGFLAALCSKTGDGEHLFSI